MDRDALEKFIDLQDKENDIDTKSKIYHEVTDRGSVTPTFNQGSSGMSPKSVGSSGRNKNIQLQLTPTKADPTSTLDSHPLKGDNSDQDDITGNMKENEDDVSLGSGKVTVKNNGNGVSAATNGKGGNQELGIRRSNTWKRKSLIMPLMSPEHTVKQQQRQSYQQHCKPSESVSNTPLGRKYRSKLDRNDGQKSVRSSISSIGSLLPDGATTEFSASPATKLKLPTTTTDTAKVVPSVSEDDNDMESLLQSLANKELEILERTRRVHDLFRQIKIEDKIIKQNAEELQQLKKKVSRLVGNQVQGQNSNTTLPAESHGESNNAETADNKSSSLWTKSVSLLNQFDQIIQGTVETKLGLGDSGSSATENQSEGKPKGNDNAGSAIWSLVNEFKNGLGLLATEEEDADGSIGTIATGLATNMEDYGTRKAESSTQAKEIEMYHYSH